MDISDFAQSFSDDPKPFSVHTQAPGLLSGNTQFRKNSTVSPNQKHLCRHSRAGGNPLLNFGNCFSNICFLKFPMDSRLRRNDGVSIFEFSMGNGWKDGIKNQKVV